MHADSDSGSGDDGCNKGIEGLAANQQQHGDEDEDNRNHMFTGAEETDHDMFGNEQQKPR